MITRLLRTAAPSSGWLAASLVFRLAGAACGIGLIALPAFWIMSSDVPVRPGIGTVATVLVALALIKALARYLEQYTGHHAAFDLLKAMRLRLLDALLPQAPGVVTHVGAGRLLQVATRDIDRIEVFFAHTIVPTLAGILVPTGAATAIVMIAGPSALLVASVGFLVGTLVVPLIARRTSSQSARDTSRLRTSLTQHITESVVGLLEIRSLRAEAQRLDTMRTLEGSVAHQLRRAGTAFASRTIAGTLWPAFTILGLLALAASGVSDLPGAVASCAIVWAVVPQLESIQRFTRSLPAAVAAAERYFALLERRPAVEDVESTEAVVPAAAPAVRLEAVSVVFPGGDAPVLDKLDQVFPAGAHTALIGPSGAGKSTIARLLVRELDPEEGRVLLGDVDVRSIPLARLRALVTIVEQKATLLSGSVFENLRLGRPELTQGDAWRALRMAHLDREIRALDEGIDTQIGTDGDTLSGGQRQRLALARALARRPRVLVLDEATSHQDPQTQIAIRDAVADVTECTVIVIAHRSDAISGIDNHVVLSKPQ
ncbi:ABC transporter ATP-binding protein [Microbacterium sp. MPKO10]|uniref:ABC transporter ATP-binding protein n=1 Tax=Microbacterium sp. MPKO10 TaxID=2989818 RepID=UPI002235A0B4|nr:ABC transporter ATP-binding protein [Microbacterium sp. MPKO10]MCW4458487.1 ABC transporter ATP-binding protein/permease [Microbacterium sp. MPKO10]